MKIRYLFNEEKLNIRPLYEEVFEDSKAYVDYLFEGPIFDHDVLVLEEEDQICAMLQLVPKRMVYNHEVRTIHYIYAVATAESERRKGYMGMLLERVFEDLKAKGEPFTYLVPVNPAVYKKFGFRVAYLKSKYSFKEESKQVKVFHPNTLDAVILEKFCKYVLPKRYDTYQVHDEAYFLKLFKELELENGYLIYHPRGEQINGYTLVASDGHILDSVFVYQPEEIQLNGYTPWVMIKELSDDCTVGRMFINEET